MKNMQSRVLKIVAAAALASAKVAFVALLATMLVAISLTSTSAQVSSYRLSQADSLYNSKQYTQSLEHYQQILQHQEYSPAMLLKMAYIEEGLGRIGQALYYLNLYYLATNDKVALQKMEELAEKHRLDGYETSDADVAFGFYYDYRDQISIALGALSLLLLSIVIFRRRRKLQPAAAGFFLFTVLILFAAHLNFGDKHVAGIVGEPNTYLMNGPSAGASVISVIDEGHRVQIVGKKDVWYEIRWNGDIAYIKENSLLPIRL
jgi:tetratricopeptide (TPR) repeat protein